MKSWWYCLQCPAGGTENETVKMAEGHTKRTTHATLGTTDRALWLRKMRLTSAERSE